MRRVLLIGATSAIVEAVGRHFANDGDSIVLLGRSPQRLKQVAEDYRLRGAVSVCTEPFDALDYERHVPLIERAIDALGGLDVALIGYGTLPDQAAAEASSDVARQALEVNCISVISLMTHLANLFEEQESGTLAVISSVAGDRGRRSNYVYGTAKGAVSVFAAGLRARLAHKHVSMVTIKPGFVDTPMTASESATKSTRPGSGAGLWLWFVPYPSQSSNACPCDAGQRKFQIALSHTSSGRLTISRVLTTISSCNRCSDPAGSRDNGAWTGTICVA